MMGMKRKVIRFLFLMAAFAVMIIYIQGNMYAAEAVNEGLNAAQSNDRAAMTFAAMGAVGLSCMTSAYALAKIGSAAMGAMSEKPEVGGRALVFLGMAEGIAIYGLIIAIMILNKI